MKGWLEHEKVTDVCFIILALLFCLPFLDETASRRLGEVFYWNYSNARSNMEIAEGIRLYIDPNKRPDDTPDENGPDVRNYPEVFKTRALVVVFGASWCQWCKAEGAALVEPSKTYNIVYADIENPDGSDSRWSVLMERWNLGTSIPVTVVVEDGKVVKTFEGFTEWDTIQPFAEKAKKDESKNGFVISPLDGSQFGDVDLGNQNRNRRRR